MQTNTFVDFLKIIYRWKWVIFLVSLSTALALAVVAVRSEETYSASVTIQFSAPPPQENPLFGEYGREAASSQIDQTRESFAQFVQSGDTRFRVLEVLPDVNMGPRELRDRISVEVPQDSQLVYLEVTASDPRLAALLANTTAEVGLDGYAQRLAAPTASNRSFIEQELTDAQTRLSDAQSQLEQFRRANNVASLDEEIDKEYRLVQALELSLDEAIVNQESARADLLSAAIEERKENIQALVSLQPTYANLQEREQRTRQSASELAERSSEAEIKENQILARGYMQPIGVARAPSQAEAALSSRIIALSLVASLLAGIMLAVLLELLTKNSPLGRNEDNNPIAISQNLQDRIVQ